MISFKELAYSQTGGDFDRMSIKSFPKLAKMRNLELCIPTQKAMIPALPESVETEDYNPYAEDLPRIDGMNTNALSLSRLNVNTIGYRLRGSN